VRYKNLLKRREQVKTRLKLLNQTIEKSKFEFLLSRQSGKTSYLGFGLGVNFEIIFLEKIMSDVSVQIMQHRISKVKRHKRRLK
jgi:hypothetical protein